MTRGRDPSPISPSDAQTGPSLAGDEPARRQWLSRRALIPAGGGLILGAGATQAGNSLASSSAAADTPGVPPPGEALMTEHGVLKRLLLVYQAASYQLSVGLTPPAKAISDTADLIGGCIEGFHEGIEEAYVFPRIRSTHPVLVHTLLVQHNRGRHLTAAISSVSSQNLAQAGPRASLQRYLNLFLAMYAPHEAWEDTIAFPALRAVTPPETLNRLADRIAELQAAQYGDNGYAQILDSVATIERQLDISDIAAFTPPEINPPYD